MTKNKTIQLIILWAIAALAAACIVRPLFLSIKRNSETLVAQKEILAELEEKSGSFKKFASACEIYRADLVKIDELFIDKEEPVEFIKFLEREAASAKLGIDLTPLSSSAGEEGVWQCIVFKTEIDGSFANFLKFLGKVESNPYLIALSDFNLNKQAKNANGEMAISLHLKIYAR
ncbi:hypothetical protein KKG51_05235 [Patescibacteria group bacterium]|nr:hypothetical protein [Patescibacteria group bacterium]